MELLNSRAELRLFAILGLDSGGFLSELFEPAWSTYA
jgi:hypothetical protein